MTFKTILTLLICSIIQSTAAAQLYGKVTDETNKSLGYASISIKNSSQGTICNQEGNYELSLTKGNYEVVFQYLGYSPKTITVNISETAQKWDVKLDPTVLKLKEVTVNRSNEDPATTIIRKTIAMSIIHHKELASYSFRAYARGNFKIVDIPGFLEKEMKKEFISVGQLYVFESVSQITFNQPNSFSEKILALKSNLPTNLKNSANISFNEFQMYNPESSNSPVTLRGSKNYRYEYLGYFEEEGIIINKIKVIPKIKNSEYYSGTLNIIDNSWYIHSYTFNVSTMGAKANIKASYKDVSGIWVPNYTELKSTIGLLGIKIDVAVVAKIGNLQFVKNPLYANMKPTLIDAKVNKTEAQELNKKTKPLKKDQLLDFVEKNEKLSIASLRKLSKTLEKGEKQQLKKLDLEIVSSDRITKTDSLAYSRSDSFWLNERQVPYTELESIGFKQADSINLVNRPLILEKIKKDSLDSKKSNKFEFNHISGGHSYRRGRYRTSNNKIIPKHEFILGNIYEDTRYNAVEGLNIGINKLTFKTNHTETHSSTTSLKPQYSIARNRLNGYLTHELINNETKFKAEVGRQVFQINNNNPISTLVNGLNAILFNTHIAKFYGSKYARLTFSKTINTNFKLSSYVSSQKRSFVPNAINQSFISKEGFFEPDVVTHLNGTNNFVNPSWLSTWSIGLDYYPNLTISYNNNIKSIDKGKTKLSIKNTINQSNLFFGQLELSFETEYLLPLATINLNANLGTFYVNSPTNLIDYKHFEGNINLLSTHRGFRQLEYYTYSGTRAYAQYFLTVQPKRLLVSFIPITQKIGLKEYLFNNTLLNSHTTNHIELGYGLSILSNKVSVEYLQAYQNGTRQFSGMRIILPLGSKINIGGS